MYDYISLKETDDYLVYSVARNLYPGVEVVTFIDEKSDTIKRLVEEYQKLNYSVRVCSSKDAEYIEDYLFNWFFQVEYNNQKIKYRYQEYTDAVMSAYGIPEEKIKYCLYRYVECSYSIERGIGQTESSRTTPIIKSLRNELDQQGIKLIIVEAPAGYGKTSTAMELLNSYSDVKQGVRPFYMELARDRQAPTFYYLLISQINKTFNVLLGDEIVRYNIMQGRIPLIIDGFDELLSEDLDKGNASKARRKGETMLSTIAELLKTNAKIVLTTRKTAILSGQEFFDWYEQHIQSKQDIEVVRYKLEMPKIEDWLDDKKIKILSPHIRELSNPVLLGYLHFLSFNDFQRECDSDTLVKNYVERLLTREISRQQLPFSKDDQKLIFERLASAFAYDDITAEARSNVKDSIMLMSDDLLSRYSTPSKDAISLANTLTNHALLDRKGDSNIGFINDFVLGIFLGYSMIEECDNLLKDYYGKMSSNFVEKVILSISACDVNIRESVWCQLQELHQLTQEMRFLSDVKLLHQTGSDYNDVYLEGYVLSSTDVGGGNSNFTKCYFVNMSFFHGEIQFDNLVDCTFINCSFNQVNMLGDTDNCDFYNCKKDGVVYDPNKEEVDNDAIDIEYDDSNDVQWVEMLSKYLLKGGNRRKMQTISRLKAESANTKEFKKIFNQLCANGFILTNGDLSHLSDKGLEYLNGHKNGYC